LKTIRPLAAAIPIVVVALLPHPAAAVAGLNLSADCNSAVQCVEAQCEASLALVEDDRQLTVVVGGTATSEGPVAPAATLVECTIEYLDSATGEVVNAGGCVLRLFGAASACAGTVRDVPLGLFSVCAGGDAVFFPSGYVSTRNCELLTRKL